MKLMCVLILLILSAYSENSKWGIPSDDEVSVLTDDNFEEFVNKHQFVLVKFYTPWCAACKKMAPGYSKLAKNEKHESF